MLEVLALPLTSARLDWAMRATVARGPRDLPRDDAGLDEDVPRDEALHAHRLAGVSGRYREPARQDECGLVPAEYAVPQEQAPRQGQIHVPAALGAVLVPSIDDAIGRGCFVTHGHI